MWLRQQFLLAGNKNGFRLSEDGLLYAGLLALALALFAAMVAAERVWVAGGIPDRFSFQLFDVFYFFVALFLAAQIRMHQLKRP